MIHKIYLELKKSPVSLVAALFLCLFVIMAIFAPLLASNQPLFVWFEGSPYCPLFRYLLYPGFYTKSIDRFFNLLLLFVPLFLIFWKRPLIPFCLFLTTFVYLSFFPIKSPPESYDKLENLIEYTLEKRQQEKLLPLLPLYHTLLEEREGKNIEMSPDILPTLWNIRKRELKEERSRLERTGDEEEQQRLKEREKWLESRSKNLFYIMPLIRPFHYEVDAGGNQLLNMLLPWYELTRLNRKDLTAALIFGTRISLVVGIGAVSLAAFIGLPFGAAAGYFGGRIDLIFSRVIEVWEGMPVFFMLLMIVAITESKTIGWLILIIALFGWTSFARYVRSEAYRIRTLPFILAAKTYGASESRILFRYLLPNALVSFFALLPFAILGAITAESGISFLGLGDEGSPSLGVLMDEGRNHFPAESNLLWPPALFLTLALISFALLGDTLKNALDPKRS
jgi:peptide/nickel transport system permease protein